MSRTDAHMPYHVKGAWEAREVHRHENGECTLPPRGKNGILPSEGSWLGCHWDYNWYAGYMQCNCPVCRYWGYDNDKRKARYSARKEIREQLADLDPEPEYCVCGCHAYDDCCFRCDNDYSNLCSG